MCHAILQLTLGVIFNITGELCVKETSVNIIKLHFPIKFYSLKKIYTVETKQHVWKQCLLEIEKECRFLLFGNISLINKYSTHKLMKDYVNLRFKEKQNTEVINMFLLWYVHIQSSETASVTDHLLGWQYKPKPIITSLINGLSLCTTKHMIHALTQQASGQIW